MNRLQELIDRTHKHGVALAKEVAEKLRLKRGLERLNAERRKELKAQEAKAKAKPKAKPTSRPPPPPPAPAARRFGIDFAWGTISMADLKKAGVTFVIRYLSHDSSKNLHDDYADLLAAAGIDTVVIWETTAERAKAGRLAGAADASEAFKQALACGMPKGKPIYFAVDFDASGSDVKPYFLGAAGVLGFSSTGVYGGFRPVAYLMQNAICRYGWQTYAWSGGRWFAGAQLFQYSNGHNIGGVEVDYDHSAAVADFGQWRG